MHSEPHDILQTGLYRSIRVRKFGRTKATLYLQELFMSGSAKLPKEVRTQLGIGAILTIIGMVWMFLIVFILKPDQIVPTKDALSDAYDGMRAIAGIPFDLWT